MLVPTLFCVTAERSLAKLSQSDSLALESLAEEIKNSSNISAPALSSIGRKFEFVCGRRVNGSSQAKNLYSSQGRSQNLKEVPQNFTEVFNIDDVTANDIIQRNQHRKEENRLESHGNR